MASLTAALTSSHSAATLSLLGSSVVMLVPSFSYLNLCTMAEAASAYFSMAWS